MRGAAAASGISKSTVHRVFWAFSVQPHRTRSFKISTDPFFVEKVRDIAGLYLNPPDHALVLCVDEKSQIQALNRHAAGAADGNWLRGRRYARLCSPRNDHPVRRTGCRDRSSVYGVQATAPASGVSVVSETAGKCHSFPIWTCISFWITTPRTSTPKCAPGSHGARDSTYTSPRRIPPG